MKIGCLSDTHLKRPDPILDHILNDLFAGVDMVLHAGDIAAYSVLEWLQEKGVIAVCGNMDDYEILDRVPQVRNIEAAGKQISLVHGWGSKERLAERILAKFSPDRPDIVVFGHSHAPFWGEVDGTYMFNPGSASQNRFIGTGTVGILEIGEQTVHGNIISVGE
jgi:hypothetical protein